MDSRKLIEILRATIEPNQRQQAEKQLSEIHKSIGFAPSLLQVVMTNDVQIAVRQAGVIYLKYLITLGWREKESEDGEPMAFSICEQDRAMIRDMIVDAIIQAPEVIRIQLCLCLGITIKNDFPSRQSLIVNKIRIYLQNSEPNVRMGALLYIYQFIKSFDNCMADKRVHLIEAMKLQLPGMYNMIVNLLANESAESVLIQKLILKCFYGLVKFVLPLDLITKDLFTKWMEVFRAIMERPVPEHTLQVDEDERIELPWWKCKKWVMHIFLKILDRYGRPVDARYDSIDFASWYLRTFTEGILNVLLRVLDQYRNKIYVSRRVLQQTLHYFYQCVSRTHAWRLLKPHMFAIIQDVLLPLMSNSEADKELWNSDPHEYIRIKFDIFEDFVSPVSAAQLLLTSCCRKRKGMMECTTHLCMKVLTNQNGEYEPSVRDGALHMIGTLNDLLRKKKIYKDQIDSLLSQYVFPEFHSPLGYMRARACFVLHSFANINYRSKSILIKAVNLTIKTLLTDTELPVQVEAAIALQMLLAAQENVNEYVEPQIKAVTTKLLEIIRETQNYNIANVVQKIVPMYTEQLMPMAYEITNRLATTFSKLITTDSETDEKAVTAIGLLNTMETILNVMENNPEIMAKLESTILPVVGHILHHSIIQYYEEAMTLMCYLTSKTISEDMWKVLELLYQVFGKEGFDHFVDMMPVFYNYITVDTNAFLSNENHILVMFSMAQAILNSDTEDKTEVYAAKLLEVMVLQCSGKIDNCLPSFVELVLNRLTRNVESSKLRTTLLQILIAILCYNPHFLFFILNKLQESIPNASLSEYFVKQWILDTDCFYGIHSRKLYVLGICTLLELGSQRPDLDEVVSKVLPSCLRLFEALRRAREDNTDSSDETSSVDDDEEEDEEILSSDEDDIDEMCKDFMKNMATVVVKECAQHGIYVSGNIEDYESDEYDDDDFEPDETPIECYTTPLDDKDCPVDEYVMFKNTLSALSANEPAFYHALTSILTEEQQEQLNAIFVLADQRKAQGNSKRFAQKRGYPFTEPAQVPKTFKFAS